MFKRLRMHWLTLICLLIPFSNSWAAPKIESWNTENGAKVLFVPSPGLPMVDIRVVFNAGSARDGARPGTAVLTNGLLTESAGKWSADEVAERMESVGAVLSNGAQRDMAWVTVRSLTDKRVLDRALETLAAVLAEPRFVPDDLERLRQTLLSSLMQEAESLGDIAEKAFYATVYQGHPYGSNPNGSLESLKLLSEQDVKTFYRRYYVANNAIVAIVGDLSPAEARAVAQRAVSGLQAGDKAPALPEPAIPGKAVEKRIDYPSSQTHIYLGQPGVKRGDPDYFPLYVGNHILGGNGLVSILSEEVREKRGLSYSVSSHFMPMSQLGPFQMTAQTQNSQARVAVRVMRETLQRFMEEGPTEKELESAKRNISGGFPMTVASNAKIVQYLAMIGFYGLPLDYLDRLVPNVEAVTKDQVRDAFQRRLKPERFITITVGAGGDGKG
ncbi:MAG: insulinase family protein [Gammaproteobacteria bacterium]|nr:insulinase family protein [Gammaproteobacteria bacterium]MBU1656294.1 insulinase family protein [Gammaproteobacteria bacterium]MBU1959859.1 insulinase family protein [Gammaproteobacteria bacterium]